MTTPLSGPPPPEPPFPLLPPLPSLPEMGSEIRKTEGRTTRTPVRGWLVEGWGDGSQEMGPGRRPDEIQETEQTTAYPSLDRAHTSADPDAEPSLDPP